MSPVTGPPCYALLQTGSGKNNFCDRVIRYLKGTVSYNLLSAGKVSGSGQKWVSKFISVWRASPTLMAPANDIAMPFLIASS